jgi:hypothetical protein
MKKFVFAFAAASLLAGSVPTYAAAPCKDAKGKFIKCPAPKPATCRDSKGKFIKCPTAPAKPRVCKDAKGKFTKCK